MALFVDTSVWSLAFRRDGDLQAAQVKRLREALIGGEPLLTTGVVVQELLQGFNGPKARELLLSQLSAIPMIRPARADHIAAADLHNSCRRNGVQCGTIDALLAQLCIRAGIEILTTDNDFTYIAKYSALKVWQK